MPIILPIYLSEDPSDKNLGDTSIYIMEQQSSDNNLDLSINKRTPKIIFKIKKYYIMYIQNNINMDFDISETAVKNTLIYRTFNKES